MGTFYRAQLLLEPEQHRALTEIAGREGRSVSDLVREIVRQHLVERDRDARKQREMQAIEALAQIRKRLQEEHGVYQGDPLAEVRAEREEEMARIWRGEA